MATLINIISVTGLLCGLFIIVQSYKFDKGKIGFDSWMMSISRYIGYTIGLFLGLLVSNFLNEMI